MSQILIFADVHIYPHKKSSERLQHCLDTLEWAFQTAIDRKIKEVIFCGDLFHERQTIDVLTYQKTFEIFEKYLIDEKDYSGSNPPPFNIKLLLGNHDLWHLEKWDVSSVNPFRALDGVTVIDKPCTIDIFKSKPISFLPYTHDPISDLKKVGRDKDVKHWEGNKRILFGHVAIDGALWNVKHSTVSEVAIEHDGDMTIVGPEIFDGWDQVFLGHYHAEQVLGDKKNIEYVGSPLQLNFGEAFQHKHIIIYDIVTGEKEYIRNEFSPKHFIISDKDLDKYDLENNFIRVMVDDISASTIIEMRHELLKDNNLGSLEIKPKKHVEEDEQFIEDAKSILYHEDEMLEKYVDEADIGDLEKDKLLEIGKGICRDEHNL